MKSWHHTLLGVFIGLIAAAAVLLVSAPPRGNAVELLPAPTPAPIQVHVDGAVNRPGVYALPRDSRVQEAIDAAGGFSLDANAAAVNLAARLKDGEKVIVPAVGEPVPSPQTSTSLGDSSEPPDESLPAVPVNLNTAGLEELMTLPGIGETRAKQIIEYRDANGGFKTIDEIQNVSGIGPATFERMKAQITVE